LHTCDTCGASDSNRRVQRLMLNCRGESGIAARQDRGTKRELMPRDVYEIMIDQMAGLVLTKLGGRPARVAGHDLGLRRRAETVLRELRNEIANACLEMAAKCGEPPRSEHD